MTPGCSGPGRKEVQEVPLPGKRDPSAWARPPPHSRSKMTVSFLNRKTNNNKNNKPQGRKAGNPGVWMSGSLVVTLLAFWNPPLGRATEQKQVERTDGDLRKKMWHRSGNYSHDGLSRTDHRGLVTAHGTRVFCPFWAFFWPSPGPQASLCRASLTH